MIKLPIALAISFALLGSAFGQPAASSTGSAKAVFFPHKAKLADVSITVESSFDVKLIDVTDHVPGTVKLHPGDEVVVAADPRESSCCGDLNKSIDSVTVAYHNPDGGDGPPVLVFSNDRGAPIVRAFIGNNKGTATLTIEITCRDKNGQLTVLTKTVSVVVH